MKTKRERIDELLVIISNKSGRIKKLKFECGQQSTQICVLNLQIKELYAGAIQLNADCNKAQIEAAERIKALEAKLEIHRWIPVGEKLPKEGMCLVLCEGKVHEIKVRISEDEWEDNEGKSVLRETACCDIRGLGTVLIGHDTCITYWKPVFLPEQALKPHT